MKKISVWMINALALLTAQKVLADETAAAAETTRAMAVNTDWIMISLLVGFLIALMVTAAWKAQLKSVRSKWEAYDYVRKDSLDLRSRNERFLYRNIQKVPIPKPTQNGQGGQGGQGGMGGHGGTITFGGSAGGHGGSGGIMFGGTGGMGGQSSHGGFTLGGQGGHGNAGGSGGFTLGGLGGLGGQGSHGSSGNSGTGLNFAGHLDPGGKPGASGNPGGLFNRSGPQEPHEPE